MRRCPTEKGISIPESVKGQIHPDNLVVESVLQTDLPSWTSQAGTTVASSDADKMPREGGVGRRR